MFIRDYDNMTLHKAKGSASAVACGLLLQVFPYVQNTRSLRNRPGHFMRHAEPYSQSLPATLSMAIRESILMMDWIRLKAEHPSKAQP